MVLTLNWSVEGDELSSDSYPMKLVDDIVYEFEGKNIAIKNGIPDEAIGGNKSADVAEEEYCDSTETQINFVYANRLVEISYTKSEFTKYIKVEYRLSLWNKAYRDFFPLTPGLHEANLGSSSKKQRNQGRHFQVESPEIRVGGFEEIQGIQILYGRVDESRCHGDSV